MAGRLTEGLGSTALLLTDKNCLGQRDECVGNGEHPQDFAYVWLHEWGKLVAKHMSRVEEVTCSINDRVSRLAKGYRLFVIK